ncbi:hypothetical protein JOE49_000072 [Paenibacillus sp. PvR133]|uniref:hypothetical protein n=1 Tax=Paenibacillus sp. PvR133 TaxID=2806598 RepID=UPI001AEA4943|nr:hypothetical protein [Paenibacillus sp. PvR133]MBP1172820.1 hypothetical protein [Paenibacillus sp. PvR133]
MAKEKKDVQQVSYDLTGRNELILTESKSMRDDLVFKDEVLDKVKFVACLDGTTEVTVEMAASYYEVPTDTIQSVIRRNRSELNEYSEVRVLKGKTLTDFKTRVQGEHAFKGISSLTLLTRRGLLRIGMLLTESEVAKSIRNYLLNVEEIADAEQRQWAIEREISKRERRRLTDSIQAFYNGSLKDKGFEYATFTNLVYKVLWDTDANGLREMYSLEKKEAIRDALSTEDLRKVVDVETAISSLIRLNKDYREIRNELVAGKENFR